MPIKAPSDREIWHDAMGILLAQMSPAKAIRILSALQVGHGDYVREREEFFPNKTVREIAEEARRYERRRKKESA